MKFSELEHMLQSAAYHTMSKKKLIYSALVLLACSLFMIFGMSVSLFAGSWVSSGLYFVSFFLSLALVMALGVILIRYYHDEIKERDVTLKDLILNSWSTALGALSLFVPVVLGYLALWMAQGVFLVCASIPFLGQFVATIFSFVPFLLNLATLMLGMGVLYALFCLTPTLSLTNSFQQGQFSQVFRDALRMGFMRMLLFIASVVPLAVSLVLLGASFSMTMGMLSEQQAILDRVLQWFFIMVPFSALLAPAVIFFFNLATQTHVYIQRQTRQEVIEEPEKKA